MAEKLKSAIYKAGIGASMLAGFLLTSKDALAQNIANNQKKTTPIENTNGVNNSFSIPATSPLGIIQKQIKQYPQELQDHYKIMMNSFYIQEEINLVNNLLQKNIFNNIIDADEGSRVALQCIETIALKGRTEPKISRRVKINKPINESNRTYILDFRTGYQEGFIAIKPILDNKVNEVENNIKNSENNIQNTKIDFINSLKKLEKLLVEKTYSNKQDFSKIRNDILENAAIMKVDIKKDFPNVRQKIQETEK